MWPEYKIVFIASRGGAVIRALLRHELVLNSTLGIAVDRECDAERITNDFGIGHYKLYSKDGSEFSRKLDQTFQDPNTIFLSFYTKILSEEFLKSRSGKVFNCHPSLLPFGKGLKGFEDTIRSSPLFMGCTLHEMDLGIDTGQPVIQVSLPLDRSLPIEENRHKIFIAQYISALQFFVWLNDGKLKLSSGSWSLDTVKYKVSAFSPNLDKNLFERLNVDQKTIRSIIGD